MYARAVQCPRTCAQARSHAQDNAAAADRASSLFNDSSKPVVVDEDQFYADTKPAAVATPDK
jgi:hypothetical protein